MADVANQCDTHPLLSLIPTQTLIITGRKDGKVPMKIIRELARGISGSRLVLVDDDHLFAAKNPDPLI